MSSRSRRDTEARTIAKAANAGDLRTWIAVFSPSKTTDASGYKLREYHNAFGEGVYLPCKWVNAYGSEAIDANRYGLGELATLTLRYTPLLTPVCRIYRNGDTLYYDVISVNNVEERGAWLEVKIARKAAAI